MPNEPPTLPVRTRSFSTGTPRMPLSRLRWPNTPWQPRRRISRSASASYSPIAERGSIGTDDDAVVAHRQFRDVRGAREGGGDLLAVAVMEIQADIAGRVRVQQRRIRRRGGACRRDRRQRIDIDEDRLGGVLRQLDGLGHHHGDRLADITHPIGRERPLRRTWRGRAVAMLSRRGRHVP